MAEDEQSLDIEKGEAACAFKHVILMKSKLLGVGRYGAVCTAKCDALTCSAKILHPALFHGPFDLANPSPTAVTISQFQKECDCLRNTSHPNILQYLGVFFDSDSASHVWLFELMDQNLTTFLEESKEMVPYNMQVKLCFDMALALAFLHSIDILHCNLTSNNVLVMRNGCRAKVCDFQRTKFGATSLTSLPRRASATVYLPPEAAKLPPVFIDKSDCFSYGVLGIQIATRQLPDPTVQFVTIDYPQAPTGTIEVPVPEAKRREAHIAMVTIEHPLREVLLDCLKDREQERPIASELCQRLAQAPSVYSSLQQSPRSHKEPLPEASAQAELLQVNLKALQSQVEELQAREEVGNVQHATKVQALTLELDQSREEVKQYRTECENSQNQISILRNHLVEAKKDIKMQEARVSELNFQLQNVAMSKVCKTSTYELVEAAPGDSRTLIRKTVKNQQMLQWEMCQQAPTKITQGAAAVKEDLAYFASTTEVIFHDKITKLIAKYSIHKKVFEYSSKDQTWSTLPEHPYRGYALVIVQGFLTAIGGKEINGHHTVTNKLFSLCRAGVRRTDRKWNEIVKPMPTRRFEAAAASNEHVLVVAGGLSNSYKRLDSVDVLTVETQQWATATSLPFSVYSAVAVIHEDRFYITGGFSQRGANRSVVSSSVEDLLESQTKVWIKIASVPLSRSTCASIQGELLAIGGIDSMQQTSSAVYRYDEDGDCWEVVGHMLTPRYNPLVTVLPDNKLIVVGGHKSPFEGECDIVEVATPCL